MNKLVNLLKKTRKEKGITIRKLADNTKVSPSYISQIENGHKKNPKQYVLKTLAEGMGEDFDDLLHRAGLIEGEESEWYEDNSDTVNLINRKENGTFTYSEMEKKDLYELLSTDLVITHDGKVLSEEDKKDLNEVISIIMKRR